MHDQVVDCSGSLKVLSCNMYLNVEQSFRGTDQGRPMPNIWPAAANIWVIY